MKRRDFMTKTAVGIMGAGLGGCSSAKPKNTLLWKELAPVVPRPRGGSIPVSELGKTGIKI